MSGFDAGVSQLSTHTHIFSFKFCSLFFFSVDCLLFLLFFLSSTIVVHLHCGGCCCCFSTCTWFYFWSQSIRGNILWCNGEMNIPVYFKCACACVCVRSMSYNEREITVFLWHLMKNSLFPVHSQFAWGRFISFSNSSSFVSLLLLCGLCLPAQCVFLVVVVVSLPNAQDDDDN